MPKEYVPKSVKLVGEPDQYGNNGYSVLFSNGENAFMKAQKEPVVGKEEWGEIIDAPKKSGQGTYKKFKRMQKEDAPGAPQRPQRPSKPDTAINRMSAIKTAAQAVQAGVDYDTLQTYAELILMWIEDGEAVSPDNWPVVELPDTEKPKLELPPSLRKSTTSDDVVPIELYTEDQEPEISLDDIPF